MAKLKPAHEYQVNIFWASSDFPEIMTSENLPSLILRLRDTYQADISGRVDIIELWGDGKLYGSFAYPEILSIATGIDNFSLEVIDAYARNATLPLTIKVGRK